MTEPASNPNLTRATAPSANPPAVMAPIPLKDYLLQEKPSPGGYLGICRKFAPPLLTDSEIDEITRELALQPRAMARLAALLIELSDPGTIIACQATGVTEAFVRRALPAEISLPPLKPSLAPGVIKTALRRLVGTASSPELRRKRLALVELVWWVARLRGVVAHEELLEILAREFAPPAIAGTRTSGQATDSLAAQINQELSAFLQKPSPRAAILRLAAAFELTLASANAARDAESAQVAELRLQIAGMEATITTLRSEVEVRDAQLAESEQRIVNLGTDLADQQAITRQARRALKTRELGFLNSELTRSLRDAYDAATSNPVRAHVILDRLETALNALKKETQWLESSD